jgi:stearoyl-CoA desaturase (delta-9 desaturase)
VTATLVRPEAADVELRPPRNRKYVAFFASLHVAALAGLVLLFVGHVAWQTLALSAALLVATGLSITAGYHRLFAHRTYAASRPVRWAYIWFGSMAWQGSVLVWASNHRRHHRFTDTADDPHAITRGFWWAHMGWLLRLKTEKGELPDDIDDLVAQPSLRFQHRNYELVAALSSFVFPMVLGALWGDLLGGLLVAGALRTVVLLHITYLINSAAHTVGSRPYDLTVTARDNRYLALLTFGEGYHNFHHRFPSDYRNGVRWWQFDPTKWLIVSLSMFGLVSNLRRVPRRLIVAARANVKMARLIVAPSTT